MVEPDRSLYPFENQTAHRFSIQIEAQESEPLPLIKISYNGHILRELPAFGMAQGTDQGTEKFRAGVMGCSPLSDGCEVSFDEISVEGS